MKDEKGPLPKRNRNVRYIKKRFGIVNDKCPFELDFESFKQGFKEGRDMEQRYMKARTADKMEELGR